MAEQERYLTVTEAAATMGAPVRSVRRWCASGALPSVPTPGGHHRIPVSVLRDRADLAGYSSSRAEELAGY